MNYEIRDYRPEDAEAVNSVVIAAFEEYRTAFSDWSAFSHGIGNMASLSALNEIIVAYANGGLVGAVAYVASNRQKDVRFKPEWPIIRLLSVVPAFQGMGIGRALTEECIRRARRDGSAVIALHTSPIMKVALPMYQRMGFEFYAKTSPIFGVPYAVYLKQLSSQQGAPPNAANGTVRVS